MIKRSREEYESLLNDVSLLGIDREKDGDAYAIAKMKFINELVEYLSRFMRYIYKHPVMELGEEIIDTVDACLKSYKQDKGKFLTYYMSALKRNVFIANKKEKIAEKRRELTHIGRKQDVLGRNILKLAKIQGCDLTSGKVNNDFVREAAEFFGIEDTRVIKLIKIMRDTNIAQEYSIPHEGEMRSIFDFVKGSEGADLPVIEKDEVIKALEDIATAYTTCQERQKPILKTLLTSWLVPLMAEIDYFEMDRVSYEFIDREMADTFLRGDKVLQDDKILLDKDVAALFGVEESSANRTKKDFFKKVRQIRLSRDKNKPIYT